MAYKDPEKQREAHRRWSKANPEWWAERKARNIQIVREAKNKPCADCGVPYPFYVMDFDHRENKSFNLSMVAKRHYSEARLLEEIAKCDVVCANCHRERTAKRSGLVE
jgi:hypothetical protein